MSLQALTIEPDKSSDSEPCTCCGNMSRTVWGYVNTAEQTLATYYVNWTLNRVDHGANFDLVVGRWGQGASAKDRSVIAVVFRWTIDGPQFMVVDAAARPAAKFGVLAATALRRDQVVGTPLASDVFAILDAIWLYDDRIVEITQPPV